MLDLTRWHTHYLWSFPFNWLRRPATTEIQRAGLRFKLPIHKEPFFPFALTFELLVSLVLEVIKSSHGVLNVIKN